MSRNEEIMQKIEKFIMIMFGKESGTRVPNVWERIRDESPEALCLRVFTSSFLYSESFGLEQLERFARFGMIERLELNFVTKTTDQQINMWILHKISRIFYRGVGPDAPAPPGRGAGAPGPGGEGRAQRRGRVLPRAGGLQLLDIKTKHRGKL